MVFVKYINNKRLFIINNILLAYFYNKILKIKFLNFKAMQLNLHNIIFFIIFYGLVSDLQGQELQYWNPIFQNLNTADNLFNANAFFGGFGNPQFSSIDIDNDGRKDLVAFDRVGQVWLPFKNEATQSGEIKYTFQPQWRAFFPKVEYWALLRDYNCDGLEDIFCHYRIPNQGYIGIAVFKASRDPQTNYIAYTLERDMLMYNDLSLPQPYINIFVSIIDIPALDDIDGDGDMDILTFNGAGGYVEYFQNQSKELGYDCDSLIFKYADNCWGRFYESGMSEAIDLSPRIDSCANYRNWSPIRSPRHAGSTVATFDIDNDGDKDLFLGDVSFDNITMLRNGGDNITAFATEQIVFFPTNSEAVRLQTYPGAYFVDLNNDGKKDMIITPSADDYAANVNHVWFYKNLGTNNSETFELQSKDFLLSQSLDFGNWSMPVFTDIDGDGDEDLIVATSAYYEGNNTFKKCLFAYEQIGTAQNPLFKLISENYANLQQYNFERMAPVFVDLDGDGDKDILIGLGDGTLVFVRNNGSAQTPNYATPIANYKGIDVGLNAVPTIADLDNDGDFDLVIGERNGNLNYFENTGNTILADFSATPTTQTFGYIDTRIDGIEGNSAPFLHKINGIYYLFLGRENGDLLVYNNINDNLLGAFNYLGTISGIEEGRQSVAAIKSSNPNTLDIFMGNKRGGLSAYQYINPNIGIENTPFLNPKIAIFPNPNKGEVLNIESTLNIKALFITNLQGQTILPFQNIEANNMLFQLTLNNLLTNGLYFVHLIDDFGKIWVEKLVILQP